MGGRASSRAALVVLLLALVALSGQIKGDFVAYNDFGGATLGGSPGHVTHLAVSEQLTLPAPVIFENFDNGAEFDLRSIGWSGTNFTDVVEAGNDPNNPRSNTYLGWTLITRERLASVFGSRRLQVAPGQEVNGKPVTNLLSGKLLYAESDLRSGNQVQFLFSPVYDLSACEGTVLAFSSAYEQNQDSIAGIEYTLDGGQTWWPVLYLLDRDDLVRLADGAIDATTTLTQPQGDVAVYTDPATGRRVGGHFGDFLRAAITPALAQFISGRVNDNQTESKRFEVFRIPAADRQSRVQFLLFQAGTASWYWGIDNWGIYSVPYQEEAVGELMNFQGGAPTGARMKLTVCGKPLSARVVTANNNGADPASGTEAFRAFHGIVNCLGGSPLYPDNSHTLDFLRLNPARVYELVLYSDLAIGSSANGQTVSFTITDADTFQNESSRASNLAVISGDNNQIFTLDIADNSNASRGLVCRFTGIRPGADGDFRVILESSPFGRINALKLAETTPKTITASGLVQVTETTATLTGQLDLDGTADVFVCWGRKEGTTATNSWERVAYLGKKTAGGFSAQLADLQTFARYFFAFYAMAANGEVWSQAWQFRPQLNGLLYATGFEPQESAPFLPGNLQGQGQQGVWQVPQGNAMIQNQAAAHGVQAVQAGRGTIQVALIERHPVVWVDAFFLESGATNAPIIPTNIVSSVLFFSATSGILALNGDGQGGGTFLPAVDSFPSNAFVRVTIRNDYTAKKHSVWIDGVERLKDLGFKDNIVNGFNGALRRTAGTSYLDDFSVSLWGLDKDSDGDGLVDLDEAKFYGSYPLLADSDHDGAGDAQEVLAGTDPAEPTSVFALKIGMDEERQPKVIVPTITGRLYTLQRRQSLTTGQWEDLSGFTKVPGDGQTKLFLQTPDGTNYFYRGVIINR
jgi:hypothetical protein